MNYEDCRFQALTEDAAAIVSEWEYDEPYRRYSFRGRPNGYLMNRVTWGTEQFCLLRDREPVGYIACQLDGEKLWVGWALSPLYCGKGSGCQFVKRCMDEIKCAAQYHGGLYLRVSAENQRAIRAYQRAGFTYRETIQDEVAYTNCMEDFWVMANVEGS